MLSTRPAEPPPLLLRLPPELRNKVLSLLLHPQSPYEAGRQDLSIYISSWPNIWKQQPPVTRVCRQLRREGLDVYYGGNEFTVMVSLSGVMDSQVGESQGEGVGDEEGDEGEGERGDGLGRRNAWSGRQRLDVIGMDPARNWLRVIGRENAGRIRKVRVGFVMLWPSEVVKKRRLEEVKKVLKDFGVRVGEEGVTVERIN